MFNPTLSFFSSYTCYGEPRPQSGPDRRKSVVIKTFQLRLMDPREEVMDEKSMELLTYTLQEALPKAMNGVIHVAPMPCASGFHFVLAGNYKAKNVIVNIQDAFRRGLKQIPSLKLSEDDSQNLYYLIKDALDEKWEIE